MHLDKRMKFKNTAIKLFILIFIFPFNLIWSDSRPIVEKIDINQYPVVHIYYRENRTKPVQSESIQLTETKEGYTRHINSLNILRSAKLRPVKLILSLQISSEIEKNQYSKQLASMLIQSLDNSDKIALQFFSQDTLFLNLNMEKAQALEKLETIMPSSGNKLNRNIFFLLSQLKDEEELPSILFVIHPEKSQDSDETIANIVKRSKTLKIPINILGLEEKSNILITDYSMGNFYSLERHNSVSLLQSELYSFRKTPPILEYKSPFMEYSKILPSSLVKVNLKVGGNDFELKYNLTLYSYFRSKFSNVELFYTITTILLLTSFLLLYSFTRKTRKSESAATTFRPSSELDENDSYSEEETEYQKDMTTVRSSGYSMNEADREDNYEVPSSYSYEESNNDLDNIDYNPYEDESSEKIDSSSVEKESYLISEESIKKGESYDRGVLIIKEGPHPGKQFSINQNEISIGSTAENDLVLLEKTVSPKHAKIKKVKNVYFIFDLISDSGTYLNAKKLLRPKALCDFDEIRLGKVLLIFRGK